MQVPLEDNVYTRFAGYSLLGSVLAPLVGSYASFVLVNVLLWVAAAVATYALGLRYTGSSLTATLAALLVSTAPAFEALAGQALPYVASYSLFVLGLWLFERVKLFERSTSAQVALACGLVGGLGFVFYDLYMLPAFVVVYWLLRPPHAASKSGAGAGWHGAASAGLERLLAGHAPGVVFAQRDAPCRGACGLVRPRAHGPGSRHAQGVRLACRSWPAEYRRRVPVLACAAGGLRAWRAAATSLAEAAWFVAVAVAGFAPALFMLSTWPHIPRWYTYGFPAVYILAAAAAVRIAGWLIRVQDSRALRVGLAVALILPAIVLANLDVLGATRPMELLLFQPTHWSVPMVALASPPPIGVAESEVGPERNRLDPRRRRGARRWPRSQASPGR